MTKEAVEVQVVNPAHVKELTQRKPVRGKSSDELCHKAQCKEVAKIKPDNDDNNDKPNSHCEIKEIPLNAQINFATTANRTTTNVTIPICNGVVGGPCLNPKHVQ